ncbi:Protein of unknown function DUF4817 [Trinorchestia longiramus]|nr:Protein of unknown function DUF4817 [Trinorchestia longiramus]
MSPYSKEQRIRILQISTRTMSTTEVQRDYRNYFRTTTSPSKNTIKLVYRKFTDTGNVNDKQRSGRLKSTRTEAVIERVSASVTDNPKASIRKRSTQLSISRSTLHRILKNDGVAADDSNPCSSGGGSPYDYSQALCMGILFYDAQRSGYLDGSERFDWRDDSATGDGSDNGLDLTGGYYDAGDHVKFGFPMAYSVTVLSWGLLSYRAGYESAVTHLSIEGHAAVTHLSIEGHAGRVSFEEVVSTPSDSSLGLRHLTCVDYFKSVNSLNI